MSVFLDVSEVKHLAADLQTNPTRVMAEVKRVVARTGHQVVATGQALVPVDTGALKSSISVDVDGLAFEAGPSVHYGIYQELGTSEMAPNPYMGPAFDQHLPGAVDGIGDAGERILA